MAKSRYLYEILVRGTPDGGISGAHQIWNEAYTDDDTKEIVATKEGLAQVLDVADVGAIVGNGFTGLVAQIQQVQSELADARAEHAADQAKLSEVNSELSAARSAQIINETALAEVRAELANAQSSLDFVKAELARSVVAA